jgi:hypothetical protein
MWDRMILNVGNGKFIGGLLFMASLMYGFLPNELAGTKQFSIL